MLITIKEETGIANLVISPKLYERKRRAILSASMMAVHGRIKREGEVVYLVAHRVTDLSNALASVGDRDVTFPLQHGRGDEIHHGSPGLDRRSLPPNGLEARGVHIPGLPIDPIKLKTRDFGRPRKLPAKFSKHLDRGLENKSHDYESCLDDASRRFFNNLIALGD